MTKIVKTDKAPAAIGPYSQGVIAGGFLYTSGQIAIDPATQKVVEGDIKVQARRVMENLCAILKEAGYETKDVVKTVCFLKNMSDFAAFNGIYGEYFKADAPARSCVAVASLPKDVLVEVGEYRCYLASPQEIPNTMLEIARLREITFRTVGEGTGTEKDTDIYDTYYRHLILWNIPDGKIAGAYRIGVGPEVLARPQGAQAFYTASLLEFREGLNDYLPKTMELGRSFIANDYRKEVLPLKLLLSGILAAGAHLPGMEYPMGPVSVSSDVPTFYKSLIYYYFLKNYSLENASDIVRPTTPFTPDFLRVNPDQLLSGCKNVDEFDRLLSYLSSGKVRLPVLFRKYASLGAKYLAFNIDTEFNTLDAFIIQWLGDMPANSFNAFSKFLTPEKLEEIKARLKR